MQTVKEFGGGTPKLSLRQFWLNATPIVLAMVLLAGTIILWKRPYGAELRTYFGKRLSLPSKEKTGDLESPSPREYAPTRLHTHEQALAGLPPPHPGEESEGSRI